MPVTRRAQNGLANSPKIALRSVREASTFRTT
jgi:hypothetical protein